jgi:hypothetical protein
MPYWYEINHFAAPFLYHKVTLLVGDPKANQLFDLLIAPSDYRNSHYSLYQEIEMERDKSTTSSTDMTVPLKVGIFFRKEK